MGRNLTNLNISSSFQHLLQISSSNSVNDGTGSLITDLDITASNATSASYATTASYALNATLDTGSLLVTSSAASDTITFTKGDGSQYTNTITIVSQSLQSSDLFITVKNTSGVDIGKGLAVHATGVTGENVNIKLADSDIPADMPAIGLTEEAIPNNGNGRVIINGRLKNVDTSALVAGSPVYVNGAGTLSATKPTGSGLIQNIGTAAKINATDGEIILQGSGRTNDLPNITTDYVWKGDSNGVPQAVPQSSLSVGTAATASYVAGANVDGTVASATSASHALNSNNAISASYAVTSSHVTDPNIAYTNVNNSFTGTQTFNNIDVNGTGSFAYLQSITGSAKIIGDAFIVLNNDTPTQRYAGLKVYDSGSANVTSSLVWDGSSHDWKYEYSSSATHEAAVLLTGPEMTDIGTSVYNTNNSILKGTGTHHVADSNITDNGSSVGVNANFNVTGSTVLSGSTKNIYPYVPTGSQSVLWTYPTFTTTQGTTYDYNIGAIGNFLGGAGFLENYKEWFFGNFAFTEYANLVVGPNKMTMQLAPSGTGATANIDIRRADATTSRAVIYADDIQIGRLTGDVSIGNNSHTASMFGGRIDVGGASTTQASVFGQTTLIGTTGCDFMTLGNNAATSSLIGDDINIGSSGNTSFVDIVGTEITTTGRVKGGVTSLSIASTTASLDAQAGNYFDLTLVSGSNTHVTVSNIVAGQTYILKTKQPNPGSGTITFNSEFKFSGGVAPTATGTADAVDVYTFVSYDTLDVLSTQVTDLK